MNVTSGILMLPTREARFLSRNEVSTQQMNRYKLKLRTSRLLGKENLGGTRCL